MFEFLHRLRGRPWIPGYRVSEKVFTGGFSVIYRAVQKKTALPVALKILNEEGVKIARLMKAYKATPWEGEILASLSHPNIVAVYDFGKAGDYYYFVMEFVDGVNLRQMEQAGKRTPAEALAMIPKKTHVTDTNTATSRGLILNASPTEPSRPRSGTAWTSRPSRKARAWRRRSLSRPWGTRWALTNVAAIAPR